MRMRNVKTMRLFGRPHGPELGRLRDRQAHRARRHPRTHCRHRPRTPPLSLPSCRRSLAHTMPLNLNQPRGVKVASPLRSRSPLPLSDFADAIASAAALKLALAFTSDARTPSALGSLSVHTNFTFFCAFALTLHSPQPQLQPQPRRTPTAQGHARCFKLFSKYALHALCRASSTASTGSSRLRSAFSSRWASRRASITRHLLCRCVCAM